MLDRGMLEYDRMQQEKQEKNGAQRAIESRKKRRHLEEIEKSIREQQTKAMVRELIF